MPDELPLPIELEPAKVTYVSSPRFDRLLDPLIGTFRHVIRASRPGWPSREATAERALLQPPSEERWFVKFIKRHYYAALHIPDVRCGWMRIAIPTGYELVRNWRPDIIFASGPPNSAIVVAQRIGRFCSAPWVAELRDLWSDNPYYDQPRWRLWLDRLIERRVLSDAGGLVTVSPICAHTLRQKYRQPVACVLNGYVEEDFNDAPRPPAGDIVTILYTGNIYVGYRDPSPLFQALKLLGSDRRFIAVHFYGPGQDGLQSTLASAERAGVRECVFIHPRVSHREALSLQSQADILLVLQWNDPRDAGNLSGKFFEYLGAQRPILLIGYEHGNLAQMIRERRAGFVANDPKAIAEKLRQWITQRRNGIPPVDASARIGLTRTEQFRKLEAFLFEVLARSKLSTHPDGPIEAFQN